MYVLSPTAIIDVAAGVSKLSLDVILDSLLLSCDNKTACVVCDDVVSPAVSNGDTCGAKSESVPDETCY